ncbi:hypothetical protein LINPERPRIM_LOCUS29843 [Linum perenne]
MQGTFRIWSLNEVERLLLAIIVRVGSLVKDLLVNLLDPPFLMFFLLVI